MKINYNVKGAERKALADAISRELNAPVKYLGSPTFAYEVGGYTIDRNGMLRGEDNPGLVADLCGLHDFKAVSEAYDAPFSEAAPVPEDVQIPCEAALGGRVSPYRDYEEPPAYAEPDIHESGPAGMSTTPFVEGLRDEAEVWAEREMRRLQLEDANVPDYSNRGQYGGDYINETDRLVIEMPAEDFTDETFANLQKLVASKASLIKKAIGAEALPIEKTENTLKFPWFTFKPDNGAEVKAYTHFVTALCEMAKTQHRVNAVENPVDNEKYAFRCFLLRLGFIGAEYKAERKLLLSRLTGNSAFKNPTKAGADDE